MTALVILAFLGIILYNLGAGLYYLLVDKGTSNRTVNALTRRIGFSVGLILLVILGIWAGVIKPHGIMSSPDSASALYAVAVHGLPCGRRIVSEQGVDAGGDIATYLPD